MKRILIILLVIGIAAAALSACDNEQSADASAEETAPAAQEITEAPTEPPYIDRKLIGTWVDSENGCTWVFNEDLSCSVDGGSSGYVTSQGYYEIAADLTGKVDVYLDAWEQGMRLTYVCSDDILLISGGDDSFICYKQ